MGLFFAWGARGEQCLSTTISFPTSICTRTGRTESRPGSTNLAASRPVDDKEMRRLLPFSPDLSKSSDRLFSAPLSDTTPRPALVVDSLLLSRRLLILPL